MDICSNLLLLLFLMAPNADAVRQNGEGVFRIEYPFDNGFTIRVDTTGSNDHLIYSGQMKIRYLGTEPILLKEFSWGIDSEPLLVRLDSAVYMVPDDSVMIPYDVQVYRHRAVKAFDSHDLSVGVVPNVGCDSLRSLIRETALPHTSRNLLIIYTMDPGTSSRGLYATEEYRIPVSILFEREALTEIYCR